MSKKKKDNKHQLPQTGDTERKPIVSKYFTNAVWLDQMHDGVRLVSLNGTVTSSHVLLTVVSGFADTFLLEHHSAWNVEDSFKNYESSCRYHLTPVFSVYWIDYLIDRVGEALYLCEYRKVFAKSTQRDTTRRDKEADRAGLEVQNKFLNFIHSYNKEFS